VVGILLTIVYLASVSSQTSTAFNTALQALTVPQDRLPDGCTLAAPAAGRLRVGFLDNVLVDTNPWSGMSRPVIAAIREVIEGAPAAPDGPPLDQRATARYLLELAEGVEEGYTAFYSQRGAPEVTVYALKFAPGVKPKVARQSSSAIRVFRGPVMAMVR
jgi:hypothetical protein